MLFSVIAGFWAAFGAFGAAVKVMKELPVRISVREDGLSEREGLLRASDLPDSDLRPACVTDKGELLRPGSKIPA
jgi:hypothetical protein